MHDDSDDDDIPVKSAGTSTDVISPTLKLDQDPGSNEFVNVIAPEEEEMAMKGPEIEARTLLVEEIPSKPVEKRAEPIPYIAEKAPPILDNDADTNAPIFTNETPLQLEPESMTEGEQTEPLPLGVRGVDDELRIPGSFDMSTASPQKQTSWMEMLKNLGL
jgi:hypothetical protein